MVGYTAGIDAGCDGADVDCDGAVDEDFTGDAVTCGVGSCLRAGAVGCVDGEPTELCTPGTPAASDATCDGVDEDCDGDTDEELGQTTCGLGNCTHTVENCVGGAPQTCDPPCAPP